MNPTQVYGWDCRSRLVCLSANARGAQVLLDGRYFLHSDAPVRAPVSVGRTLLTDYENLPRLNPDLKRVDIRERFPDGGVRIRVISDFCILTLCLSFQWIQDVRTLPDGGNRHDHRYPIRGIFGRGVAAGGCSRTNGGTRLIFDVDLVANFSIPSVLGVPG